jgi:hypothetical protein
MGAEKNSARQVLLYAECRAKAAAMKLSARILFAAENVELSA